MPSKGSEWQGACLLETFFQKMKKNLVGIENSCTFAPAFSNE